MVIESPPSHTRSGSAAVAGRVVMGASVVPVGAVVVVDGATKASDPLGASSEQSWLSLSVASRMAPRMSFRRVTPPTAQNGTTAARATSRFQPTG